MSYRKEIITAVGTLCCAIGIGFFMQGSDSAKERYADKPQAPLPAKGSDISGSVLLSVKDITLTSAEVDTPVILPAPEQAVTPVSTPKDPLPQPQETTAPSSGVQVVAEPDCEIIAEARAKAAAMVALTMSAPCLAGERVTIHHGGMIFTEMTDADGKIAVTIPALAEQAVFIMAFTNGDGAVAQTEVGEIGGFDRFVLQWKGETGFGIHAREYGADYGEDGHVWSGAAREMTAAITGEGGFMTMLGDAKLADGMMAEVYTFPSRAARRGGSIDLSVEAEVTQANCASEVEAKTLQMKAGKDVQARNLTLSVPDCDAEGSFLLLNNLFQDLKVAGS